MSNSKVRATVTLAVLLLGALSCSAEAEPTSCEEGAVDFREAAEGCETCECIEGSWSCEGWECVRPDCPAPLPITPDCPYVDSVVWASDPVTGGCCRYENLCALPADWSYGGTEVDCEARRCEPGARVPAGDGCNECVCDEDGEMWQCSDEVCSSDTPPPEEACGYWEGGCPAGEYCAFDPVEDCSSFDAPSVCRALPEVCTDDDAPVCGCDGNTYGNRCLAAQAGTGIRDVGPCRVWSSGGGCGLGTDVTCTADEYCAFQDGSCGEDGAEASCRFRPLVCIAQVAPVCGCDRRQYPNACEAAKAGVAVLESGDCP